MKEKIKNILSKKVNFEIASYIIFIIVFGILFFSFHILYTWDSMEYVGMGIAIGEDYFTDVWLSHRGFAFPLLLKIFQPFGIQSKWFFMIMLYIYYVVMITFVFKLAKKADVFNKKYEKYIFIAWLAIFVILNPYIFMYYHTILTEFTAMTFSIVLSYICFKWIYVDINKDGFKKGLLYFIGATLIALYAYHTKQSLVAMMLAVILMSVILGIVRNPNRKNILYRLVSFIMVFVLLFGSIKLWNIIQKQNGVSDAEEMTIERRVDYRLVKGLWELSVIGEKGNLEINNGKENSFIKTSTRTNEKTLIETSISEEDLEEIKKVYSGESEYNDFKILKDPDENYFVFFTNDNFSSKEQIVFILKMLFTHPKNVLVSLGRGPYVMAHSYIHGTVRWYENNDHWHYYYIRGEDNILNFNPDYLKFMENYKEKGHEGNNNLALIYNDYAVEGQWIFYPTQANIILLPFLLLGSIILYGICFIKKLKDKEKFKNASKTLEIIILLYTAAYGCVMGYSIFGANIDRYTVPSYIPMFIADILLILQIARFFIPNKLKSEKQDIKLLEDKKLK